MSKHTPGPWVVGENQDHDAIMASDYYVATVHDACGIESNDETSRANAKLIAAAPDLLEALRCSVAAFEGDTIDEIEADYGIATAQRVDMARAAIRKATE